MARPPADAHPCGQSAAPHASAEHAFDGARHADGGDDIGWNVPADDELASRARECVAPAWRTDAEPVAQARGCAAPAWRGEQPYPTEWLALRPAADEYAGDWAISAPAAEARMHESHGERLATAPTDETSMFELSSSDNVLRDFALSQLPLPTHAHDGGDLRVRAMDGAASSGSDGHGDGDAIFDDANDITTSDKGPCTSAGENSGAGDELWTTTNDLTTPDETPPAHLTDRDSRARY